MAHFAPTFPGPISRPLGIDRIHHEVRVRSGVVLRPHAKSFLQRVGPHFRVFVLSDTWMTPGRYIRASLSKLGVSAHLSGELYSDESGHHKINGSAYSDVHTRLGVRPADTIHLGDLWEADVAASRRAGVGRIIYLVNANHPVEPTRPYRANDGIEYASDLTAAANLLLKGSHSEQPPS